MYELLDELDCTQKKIEEIREIIKSKQGINSIGDFWYYKGRLELLTETTNNILEQMNKYLEI